MPPKKREAPAATTSSKPAKKVRLSEASIIEPASTPSAPGRARRASAGKAGTATEAASSGTKRAARSTTKATPEAAVKDAAKKEQPAPKAGTKARTKTATPPKPALKKSSAVAVKSKASTAKKSKISEAPAVVATKGSGSRAAGKGSIADKKSSTGAKKGAKPKVKDATDAAIVSETKSPAETSTPIVKITNGASDSVYLSDTQYWLMKAEPESRIEKGRDVKFSIDDLAACAEPEGWEGVRNPVARNNMRAMRKGDLAFFYHSNCKTPGVAGVMRIVREHSTDQSAFDPEHPYYDAKSVRDKPKWDLVHVEFVKKFDTFVTLRELRSYSEAGGALEKMQMLKQGRLSVSPVTPAEWRFILTCAGEDLNVGQGAREDGYEPDTDGEGDSQGGGAGGEKVAGTGLKTSLGPELKKEEADAGK